MAYVTIVINVPNDSIAQMNQVIMQDTTETRNEVNALVDYIMSIASGNKPASFYVVTRDTDPAVSTHGSGSQSKSYSAL